MDETFITKYIIQQIRQAVDLIRDRLQSIEGTYWLTTRKYDALAFMSMEEPCNINHVLMSLKVTQRIHHK
jgi:hypothetical protein